MWTFQLGFSVLKLQRPGVTPCPKLLVRAMFGVDHPLLRESIFTFSQRAQFPKGGSLSGKNWMNWITFYPLLPIKSQLFQSIPTYLKLYFKKHQKTAISKSSLKSLTLSFPQYPVKLPIFALLRPSHGPPPRSRATPPRPNAPPPGRSAARATAAAGPPAPGPRTPGRWSFPVDFHQKWPEFPVISLAT